MVRGLLMSISVVATAGLRICGIGDSSPAPPPPQVVAEPASVVATPQGVVPGVPGVVPPGVPGVVPPTTVVPSLPTAAVNGVPAVPTDPAAIPTDPAAHAGEAEPPPGALPEPVHGGAVLLAGNNPVEIVTGETGEVHAYVWRPPSRTPPYSELTVTVQGADNAPHQVGMNWDADESRYEGQLTGVAPAPGPVSVAFTLAGQRHEGRAARVTLASRMPPRRSANAEPAQPEPPAEPSRPNAVEQRPEPEPEPSRPVAVRTSPGVRPVVVQSGPGVRAVAVPGPGVRAMPGPGVRAMPGPGVRSMPGPGVRPVQVQPNPGVRAVQVQPSPGVRRVTVQPGSGVQAIH